MSDKYGFSLIELMIVITIIGILAAVAVPAYQDYVIRAKMVNVLTFLESEKKSLIEYYNVHGTMIGGTRTQSNVHEHITTLQSGTGASYPDSAWIVATLDIAKVGLPGPATQVAMFVAHNKGAFQIWCGQWTGTYVPIKYLPASCQDVNISANEPVYGPAGDV